MDMHRKLQEMFQHSKGAIRCHESKKDRQHNVQHKNDMKTNNGPQSTTIKK